MPRKKPPDSTPSISIFVLKGTPEFRDWMMELAAHIGSPMTVMVERAMRDLAKREGFTRMPPRRVP